MFHLWLRNFTYKFTEVETSCITLYRLRLEKIWWRKKKKEISKLQIKQYNLTERKHTENNDDAAVDRKDKQDDKQDQDKENVPNQQESENSPADKADDQQDSSAKPKEDESELGDNEDVSGESSREGDDSVDERNHPKEETPSEETPDKSQAIQEDDDLNSQEKYEL